MIKSNLDIFQFVMILNDDSFNKKLDRHGAWSVIVVNKIEQMAFRNSCTIVHFWAALLEYQTPSGTEELLKDIF